MRIYKYLFFLGLLVFTSCLDDVKVPNNVISEERMPALLADIHIVDGDLYNVSQVPDSLYKYSAGHYQAVFKKYRTDSTQFKRSYTWYTRNPTKLDAIYDQVIKILQAKTDSIAKIKPPPSKPSAPNNKPVDIPVKANVIPAQ